MNIDVMANVKQEDMMHTECFLCGNCIESCQHKALRFAWKPAKNHFVITKLWYNGNLKWDNAAVSREFTIMK